MNGIEQACHDSLVRQGYTVLRRGWPDFLVFEKSGRLGYALEIKMRGDKLSADQSAMHAALARFGVLTHTVTFDRQEDARNTFKLKSKVLVTPQVMASTRETLRELELRLHELLMEVERATSTVEAMECLSVDPMDQRIASTAKTVSDERAVHEAIMEGRIDSAPGRMAVDVGEAWLNGRLRERMSGDPTP